MSQPAKIVIPLPDDPRTEAALGARALWMFGVGVMVGVVVVAGIASAAIAVRIAS